MSLSGVFGGVILVDPSSSVADEDLLRLRSVPSSIPESCLLFKLKGNCVNGFPKNSKLNPYKQVVKLFVVKLRRLF